MWQALLSQGISDTVNLGYNAWQNWWNTERQKEAQRQDQAYQAGINTQNINAAKEMSESSLSNQRFLNAQNQALTREGWSRDDNAIQRRVADLTAAGLSPTLAAGSPAGNQQPIAMGSHGAQFNAGRAEASQTRAPAMQAPTYKMDLMQVAAAVEQLKSLQLDNDKKRIENDVLSKTSEETVQQAQIKTLADEASRMLLSNQAAQQDMSVDGVPMWKLMQQFAYENAKLGLDEKTSMAAIAAFKKDQEKMNNRTQFLSGVPTNRATTDEERYLMWYIARLGQGLTDAEKINLYHTLSLDKNYPTRVQGGSFTTPFGGAQIQTQSGRE